MNPNQKSWSLYLMIFRDLLYVWSSLDFLQWVKGRTCELSAVGEIVKPKAESKDMFIFSTQVIFEPVDTDGPNHFLCLSHTHRSQILFLYLSAKKGRWKSQVTSIVITRRSVRSSSWGFDITRSCEDGMKAVDMHKQKAIQMMKWCITIYTYINV